MKGATPRDDDGNGCSPADPYQDRATGRGAVSRYKLTVHASDRQMVVIDANFRRSNYRSMSAFLAAAAMAAEAVRAPDKARSRAYGEVLTDLAEAVEADPARALEAVKAAIEQWATEKG